MTNNGKSIKTMTYIMLFAMLLNVFSGFIPAKMVFANGVQNFATNPSIAGGNGFTIALAADGRVYGSGKNQFGQLGGGTISTAIPNFSEIIAVSAGTDHAVALKSDGTVWAWGKNNQNQIGDGTTTNRSTPTRVSGLTGIISIAANGDHTLALKTDGTLWTWGKNDKGQLGDGTTTNRSTPVQVSNITNVIAIAAGSQHSMAVKSDGTVWAWGLNGSGRLGDGTTVDKTTPVQVSGLTNVVAVSSGKEHSLALKSDGTVWSWGKNTAGQLGDGTTTNSTIPVQVSNLSQINKITTWADHSLALRNNGTVWAWGNNGNGRLGDGTTTNRTSPVQVSNLSSVGVIATGNDHSLAIKDNGEVWAWGNNGDGRLGDGTTTSSTAPVLSNLLAAEKSSNANLANLAVSEGMLTPGFDSSITGYTIAVDNEVTSIDITATLADSKASMRINGTAQGSGTARTIHLNEGDNTVDIPVTAEDGTTQKTYRIIINRDDPVPVEVPPSNNADLTSLAVSAGMLAPAFSSSITDYTLTVTDSVYTVDIMAAPTDSKASVRINGTTQTIGTARTIHLNERDDTVDILVTAEDEVTEKNYTVTIKQINLDADVPGALVNVVATAGNSQATVTFEAPAYDGGSPITQYTVTSNPEGITATGMGNSITVTGLTNGIAYTFKVTATNMAGTGPASGASNSVTPISLEVPLDSNADLANLTVSKGILTPAFDGSITHYMVDVANGIDSINITAIPASSKASMEINGLLYNGGTARTLTLSEGDNVVEILVVAEDGVEERTYTIIINRAYPDDSSPETGTIVLQVASGNNHSLGLKSDGTVWTWGNNENGRLGNGTMTQSNSPVKVTGLTDVIAIAAGNNHSMALKSDGTVWTWGKNDKGQLGNDSTADNYTPVQVSGLTDVKAIAAGNNHSMALKEDGTVWTWGDNGNGRLGDGTTTQRNTPVQVLKGVTASSNTFLQGVSAIEGGNNFSLVIKDGLVYSWGQNEKGQLGNGTNTASTTPVAVSGLTGVTVVTARGDHVLVLLGDGTVRAWGKNDKGQIGDNSTSDKNAPVQVYNLANVKAVSAGNNFSVALKEDGTVWTWGDKANGRLGDGTDTQRNTPVQVVKGSSESTDPYLGDIIAISAGNGHVLAVKANRTVWAWGTNDKGQLGDDSTTHRTTPVMNLLAVSSDEQEQPPVVPEEPLVEDAEIDDTYSSGGQYAIDLSFSLLNNIDHLLAPLQEENPGNNQPEDPDNEGTDGNNDGDNHDNNNNENDENNDNDSNDNNGNSDDDNSSNADNNDSSGDNGSNDGNNGNNGSNERNRDKDSNQQVNSNTEGLSNAILKNAIENAKSTGKITLSADSVENYVPLTPSQIEMIQSTAKPLEIKINGVTFTLDVIALKTNELNNNEITSIRLNARELPLTVGQELASKANNSTLYQVFGEVFYLSVSAVFKDGSERPIQQLNGIIQVRLPVPVEAQDAAVSGRLMAARFNEAAGTWSEFNGQYDAATNTFRFETDRFSYWTLLTRKGSSFSDIVNHWAQKDIEYMTNHGYIKGMGDGIFAPDAPVTRAQFAVMLVNVLQLTNETEIAFEDVAPGQWYTRYVKKAYVAGLVKGYSPTQFNPSDSITREQMAAMVCNALRYKNLLPEVTAPDELLDRFSDQSGISGWARLSTAQAVKQGILKGRANNGTLQFAPQATATRAEAVTMLKNMIDQLN